jgi:hypothetical protein
VAVPAVSGLIAPVLLLIVAIEVALLAHVPPDVAFAIVVFCPIHTSVVPVIEFIGAVTVTVTTWEQLEELE